MNRAAPKGSAVYIRYRDHVLFRNTTKPIDKPAERETLGWLKNENAEVICIIWDRNVKPLQNQKNSPHSGLVILKNCIIEARTIPLQNFPRGSLSCQNHITNTVEYALQTGSEKLSQSKRTTDGSEQ